MKICNKCKLKKSDASFYSAKTKAGLRPRCKKCAGLQGKAWYAAHRTYARARGRANYKATPERKRIARRSWLKQQYGLTENGFETMLAGQNNQCKLCERPLTAKICVDHDHTTGIVRGLLCNSCNTALGKLKDSPALLRKAAKYIEDSK